MSAAAAPPSPGSATFTGGVFWLAGGSTLVLLNLWLQSTASGVSRLYGWIGCAAALAAAVGLQTARSRAWPAVLRTRLMRWLAWGALGLVQVYALRDDTQGRTQTLLVLLVFCALAVIVWLIRVITLRLRTPASYPRAYVLGRYSPILSLARRVWRRGIEIPAKSKERLPFSTETAASPLTISPSGALGVGGAALLGLALTFSLTVSMTKAPVTAVLVLGVVGVALGGLPASGRLQALQGWLRVSPGQLVCLWLGMCSAVMAALAAGPGAFMYHRPVAVIAWGLGIVLIAVGAWRTPQRPARGRALIWALALALLALPLRAVATQAVPTLLTGDEASIGLSAIRFLSGKCDNLFTIGWFSFPALFYFLESWSILALGQTVPALRVPAALAGAATVAATYLLGRALFGQRAGLLAGLFLLGAHLHLHFSRLGLNNIWDGLFFPCVLLALWLGWRRQQRCAYLLAGLGLGLAQYFYTSAHQLLMLVPAWLVWEGCKDLPRLRRALPEIALLTLMAGAVVLPLASFYVAFPNEFLAPMDRVRISKKWLDTTSLNTFEPPARVLLRQAESAVLGYAFVPTRVWYVSGVPVLRLPSALLALLAGAWLALRWRDGRSVLLGLWLGVFALSGALSVDTPAAQRYVAAVPACALLVGLALDQLAGLVAERWPAWGRRATLAVILLALALAADDARFYFLDFTPSGRFGDSHGRVAQQLVNQLKYYSSDWQVVFMGWPRMQYDSINSLPYLAPHIRGSDVHGTWQDVHSRFIAPHILFVALPYNKQDLEAAHREYPGGDLRRVEDTNGEPLYWYYEYHAENAPAPR